MPCFLSPCGILTKRIAQGELFVKRLLPAGQQRVEVDGAHHRALVHAVQMRVHLPRRAGGAVARVAHKAEQLPRAPARRLTPSA